MTEQELVKQCLGDICRKNGFEDLSVMTQRDFEFISSEMEERTGTLISVSTIKRLLHGEFSRIPQSATLNAISSYLGFKSWQEYKLSQQSPAKTTVKEIKPALPEKRPVTVSVSWKWLGFTLVTAGIIVFLSFVRLTPKHASNFSTASFGARKTTENAIPNTVVFNYNIDGVQADSFFIQQSWDRRRRVRIYKNNYTLTDIYYEPGYHVAKLIANDTIIKTVDISIPTDKWVFYAKESGFKNNPRYIKSANPIKDGSLVIDKKSLDSSQINPADEKVYLYTYFPKNISVSSDNFTLKARVRMKEVRNAQCPFIMYEVYCQRYFMYFKSFQKGCASESDAQFGDKVLNGKRADLSSLCADITRWNDIEMTVRNRQVSISINNELVYTSAYNHTAGLITGLGFISSGLCEVDFTELKGAGGKVVYSNDFNQ